MSTQIHRQNFRKQLVPVNQNCDSRLNSSPLHEIVFFIQEFLRKALFENKSIEIEGKLGIFQSKSAQQHIRDVDNIRLFTIDTISSNNIVLMGAFKQFFQFDSKVQIKDQENQIRFFDTLQECKNQQNNKNQQENELTAIKKFCSIADIIDFETFERTQNDVIVDFTFEDGTRMKVPLNPNEKITLDKKNRDAANNMDFAFLGNHYRISAREEVDIEDQNEINKRKIEIKEGKYQSVRMKYRKAYRYLFMEYAFTRVFSFMNFSKKKVIDESNQLLSETFTDFQEKVGNFILNRKQFSKQAQVFFQKCYCTNYTQMTKFESEIEIKDIQQYFKKEFEENKYDIIQSHIRSFIRNIIYLNQITEEIYGKITVEKLKEIKAQKDVQSYTGFKDGILGQYMQSHIFEKI